ncbi:hypothetical protein [Gilvimarinus agarilyticus]|uniref:hypothetical protein n=1 Tax=Gilvimarinus agarilyticus TaxID=679259 RepID=UPI0005A21EC5|nr:hypothetical protein [Gilvimarinus agarilyticus]
MEIQDCCLECGSEAFSKVNNSGFGETVLCESCKTMFKVKKAVPKMAVYCYLMVVIVVVAIIVSNTFGVFIQDLTVIVAVVFWVFSSVFFLLFVYKEKRRLVRLVNV